MAADPVAAVDQIRSQQAHQLIRLGLERGRQDVVIERLFRAHFSEQRSVFEPESLVELAAEAGLGRSRRERYWPRIAIRIRFAATSSWRGRTALLSRR